MMPSTSSSASFYQNINISTLKSKKDDKIHKIYIRFRVFKKNSITSSDSDVCITTDNKKCYSSYYFKYLNDTYGVIANNSGKIFLVDGSPEVSDLNYNPYNWALHSEIIDVKFDDSNLSNNWKLEFYIKNPNESGNVFIDDVMVIDVTNVFTEENTDATYDYAIKNYLDENLDYYDGNYVIPKCNRVNIDGDWKCV